jgi:3-oxoacyl-[acyl-carrier protein] reductase
MTAATSPERADLLGRVAIVTGAGRDPGRAVARTMAAAGARLWCIDTDLDGAKQTVDAVVAAGGQADLQAADVTARAEIEAAVDEIRRREGRIDVLCTVACEPGDGRLVEDIDPDDFDRIFRANFKGTLFACQAAGRAMVAAGRGSIVSVSSAVIDVPISNTGSYAVSAAAVAFLTKVFAKEVGEHNVRVNTVALSPAMGFSPFPAGDGDPAPDAFVAKVEADSVLGRKGTVNDLGELAVFLASDASAAITGQTIRLSGGWTMPW